MRKIHLQSGIWQYKIGNDYAVLFNPAGIKSVVPLTAITGLSWDQIERGRWKRWLAIKPSMIRDYILGEVA